MKSNLVTQTERLELRKFSRNDATGFFRLNSDPEVVRYTGDAAFRDVTEAQNFLEGYDHYALHGYGRWSVYLKETGEYIGFCGLKYSQEKDEVDLGFRFMRHYWNKGLATEAARESLRIGFEQFGLVKIVGRAMEANLASIRVLEKLGMNRAGRFNENGQVWVLFEINV